jgi:hypothetical protein
MLKILFAAVMVVHGTIHLLGVVKAFQPGALPQLTQPVSRGMGAVWMLADLLFTAAAVALFIWPREWWMVGAAAVVVSTVAILGSWTDARFGMIGNLIVLVGVAYGFAVSGPYSLRAEYDRDIGGRLAPTAPAGPITDADLTALPAPVQAYVRYSGAVGQPRVLNVRVRMHGRIRGEPADPWMPFTAEQHNFVGPHARFFYLEATRSGVPVKVYHRYAGPAASMRGRLLGLVPIVDAAGEEMTRAETVTLFNDMCLFAPATLVDPSIGWETIDAGTVRATFTNGGHTIRADLTFNAAGELTNFISDDRRRSADGGTFDAVRWSTPVTRYRTFGAARLSAGGDARWHDVRGEFAYIELDVDEVAYNVR